MIGERKPFLTERITLVGVSIATVSSRILTIVPCVPQFTPPTTLTSSFKDALYPSPMPRILRSTFRGSYITQRSVYVHATMLYREIREQFLELLDLDALRTTSLLQLINLDVLNCKHIILKLLHRYLTQLLIQRFQ